MVDDEVDLSDLAGDAEGGGGRTEQLSFVSGGLRTVRRFHLAVLEGPATGKAWESTGERCSIGSHEASDLQLDDASVSRCHCEIVVDARGVRVRDLGSKNGTVVDGMTVIEAYLRQGSLLRMGRSVVRFNLSPESNKLPLAEARAFGSLVGASAAMRAAFTVLERAAQSDATVLIEGETGTGKEGAAESLHLAGARRDKPFLVLDCSAIPATLLESELFGHERGAFTGAVARRLGVFEEAGGGSVFLDEIGELAPDLQPKLLRVLERREIRRVGGNAHLQVDVRVIAATNRDLRAEVNAGRFRADLYYRLAVVRVQLPPLRNRPEDIPLLVERIAATLATPEAVAELITPQFVAELAHGAWPGNVRELRNYLERCLVMREAMPMHDDDAAQERAAPPPAIDLGLPFSRARVRAIGAFERAYVQALLAAHDGNVTQAAKAAGINKVYLYRMMHKHGLMR